MKQIVNRVFYIEYKAQYKDTLKENQLNLKDLVHLLMVVS